MRKRFKDQRDGFVPTNCYLNLRSFIDGGAVALSIPLL